MFFIIILVLLIINTIRLIKTAISAKRMPKDTVICFTGGLGTGKTLIAVNQALKAYNRTLLLWRLGRYKYKEGGKKHNIPMPLFYSNIPVRIKLPFYCRKKEKYIFSTVLTYEHLLLLDKVFEYSVVLIDEVGQVADQYSFDNPFVMQSIQEFIRFYRHFIDGRLFVTDQSSSNIVVAVRRRLNMIYNLHEFRRFLLFFYKVKVTTVFITEDMLSTNETNKGDEYEYFFGLLPLKFFKKLDITRFFTYKKYESRVYKNLYSDVLSTSQSKHFEDYFTKYLIEIPNNADMKKEFKRKGFLTNKEMHNYIKEYLESKQ